MDGEHKGPPYLSCGAIPLSQHWLHSCWGRRLSELGGTADKLVEIVQTVPIGQVPESGSDKKYIM